MKFFFPLNRAEARVAAVIYAAAAAVATQIPLLNYLGYEFSAVTALAASVIAGFVTIAMMQSSIGSHPPDDPALRLGKIIRSFGRALATNGLLLVIPLGIISANALFVKNCSLSEGLAFFLLLPAISALFATALGFFCAAHYRHPRLLFLAFCALLLGYSAAEGYFTPAIFSYNFLYGYFPGLSYDELLPLSETLLLFRLFTLVASIVLVWMGWILAVDASPDDPTVRKGIALLTGLVAPGRRLITAALAATMAYFVVQRSVMGFEAPAGHIQAELGGEWRTEHFVIYYPPAVVDSVEIARIGTEHEFQFSQVMRAFALPERTTFASYVYPDAETKQRLIGAGMTDFSKPWRGEIHITRQSLDATLKHELVHAAAAPFGIPVLHVSTSIGLIEGLAMAVDGRWGNRTLHEYAAALFEFDAAPDIRGIMGIRGFATRSSTVSYVMAGSFCRYLIDRFGMRMMMQVYRSNDYRKVYGRTLDGLLLEWRRFLDRIPLDEVDGDGIDAYFRRPPMSAKVCPRVVARRNDRARKAFARKEYALAESLYHASYVDGQSFEALSGELMSALRRGEYGVLTTALDSIMLRDDHPARYLPLFLSTGDAYWAVGDTQRALTLYERVYHADISEGQTEAAGLRLLALVEDPHGRRILPVLLSDENDSARVHRLDSLLARGESPTLTYLRGKAHLRLQHYPMAVTDFSHDLGDEENDLDAIRMRHTGFCYLRMGEYDLAKRVLWESLNDVDTDVAEERVNEMIDRCEWLAAYNRR
jgi:tetratricopeptide (TPR) repeat protein